MNYLKHKIRLKNISIRGRVAFCAVCLEYVQDELKLKTDEMKRVIDLLWEFTETDSFDKWEIKSTEISPDTILENHPDNKFADYETLPVEQLEKFKVFYLSLPEKIRELISWSFEVGQSNLYGNTGNYSEVSLQAVKKVLELMESINVNPPKLNLFEFSKFSEEFGWGKSFGRARFAEIV